MPVITDDLLKQIRDLSDPFKFTRYASEYESAMNANAQAALVVRPTTVAGITIWNGANRGGPDLVIDRVFSFNLVSTAAAGFSSLWYCVHKEMTAPTNDITTLRGTGDGHIPDNGQVFVDEGATVVDDGWFPCGEDSEVEATGVLPGAMMQWEVKGRLKVPPQHGLSVQVVSSVTGNTFQSGAAWYRHQF